jgi:hypothetical protein
MTICVADTTSYFPDIGIFVRSMLLQRWCSNRRFFCQDFTLHIFLELGD